MDEKATVARSERPSWRVHFWWFLILCSCVPITRLAATVANYRCEIRVIEALFRHGTEDW